MELSTQELKRLAELAEAHGTADFFRAAPAELTTEHGLYLEETSSFTAFVVKNTPSLRFYNNVMGLGVAALATEADLDHLLELYGEANLSFSLHLSPEAQPPELPQWLAARGLQHVGNSAKFYRGVETPSEISTELRIELAKTERAADFTRIACYGRNEVVSTWLEATIGRKNWWHYLAFTEENIPIAAGALYLDGPVGWLGWAATLPEYRRRGAQSALLNHRIREAVRLGCHWLSVDTGEDTPEKPNSSYHNILKAGFQLAYLRPKYVYNPLLK